MEAEQLNHAASQAKKDAEKGRRKGGDMEFGEDGEGEEEGQEGSDTTAQAEEAAAQGESAAGGGGEGPTSTAADEEGGEVIEETVLEPKKRGVRVLAVQDSRVVLFVPGIGIRPFHFGGVYDRTTEQRAVYEDTARDAVLSVLNGFNACLLCYGQTGSGKTYTIFGPEGVLANAVAPMGQLAPHCGIVIRACNEILGACQRGVQGCTLTAALQYVEIYQDTVTDLISGRPVQVRAAGETVLLQGAAEAMVGNLDEVLKVLQVGEQRKRYAATAMNDRSSRAHTVFILHLSQYNNETGTMVKSQLHLVDLAGCEQLKQSKVVGARKVEAVGINSSLLVLGKCISALVESRSHVPYFESKLTLLLKAAFGGNSRTTAIITGSMDQDHGEQTFQALSFGERCSMITNSAKFAVSSVDGALASIDQALEHCERQMASLEARGKTHLESYAKVKGRYQQMKQKRRELDVLTGTETQECD